MVRLYQYLLMTKCAIFVSVTTNSFSYQHSLQCRFFQGLSRTDIRADSAAYRALKDRVSPILGNLMQVHEDMKNGIEMAPDTPPLTLIIYSWEVDGQDGERAYALWEIE